MENSFFFCLGAQKAGTSTLFNILNQHPQIYMPIQKELHFFERDERFANGINWYQNTYFPNAGNDSICGDFTPESIFFESVPERILDTIGKDAKFILILRNPIDRAFSHYKMSVFKNFEKLDFISAIKEEKQRLNRGYFSKSHFSYISRSLYSEQIIRFFNLFPMKNFLFLIFEEDFTNLNKMTRKICNHLNIPEYEFDLSIRSNQSVVLRFSFITQIYNYMPEKIKSLSKKILGKNKFINLVKTYRRLNSKRDNTNLPSGIRKDLLKKHFKDEIKKIEDLLNRDLSIWQ